MQLVHMAQVALHLTFRLVQPNVFCGLWTHGLMDSLIGELAQEMFAEELQTFVRYSSGNYINEANVSL